MLVCSARHASFQKLSMHLLFSRPIDLTGVHIDDSFLIHFGSNELLDVTDNNTKRLVLFCADKVKLIMIAFWNIASLSVFEVD
jgi:hypothetical protein